MRSNDSRRANLSRAVVFVLLYAAYAICYLSRRSAGFWGAPLVSSLTIVDQPSAPPLPTTTTVGAVDAAALAEPAEPAVPVLDVSAAVGAFSSAFESFGGISKVVSGVAVDLINPYAVLCGALAAVAGVHAIIFALPTSYQVAVSLWAVNGAAQAFAWPALASIFMIHFRAAPSCGRWYTVLATCQNAGAAAAPLLLQWTLQPPTSAPATGVGAVREADAGAARGAWTRAVLLPGLAAAAVTCAMLWHFRGMMSFNPLAEAVHALPAPERACGAPASPPASPLCVTSEEPGTPSSRTSSAQPAALPPPPSGQHAALLPCNVIMHDAQLDAGCSSPQPRNAPAGSAAPSHSPLLRLASSAAAAAAAAAALKPQHVAFAAQVRMLLTSPVLWLMGLSYCANTFFRNTFTEVPAWLLGPRALHVGAGHMATCITAYEAGSAAGSLLAGFVSDAYFRGRRPPIFVLFGAAAAPLPLILAACAGHLRDGAAEAVRAWCVTIVYFLAGALGSAPHVMHGLAAREVAPAAVQSSAGGFTKALGQVGGSLAGYPLGLAIARYGWHVICYASAAAAALSALLALPLWPIAANSGPALSLPPLSHFPCGGAREAEGVHGKRPGRCEALFFCSPLHASTSARRASSCTPEELSAAEEEDSAEWVRAPSPEPGALLATPVRPKRRVR